MVLLVAAIGLLALELVRRGFSSADTDQRGALDALADVPGGRVLVFVVSLGLGLYACRQVWAAVISDRDRPDDVDEAIHNAKRVGWVGLAVVYVLLASTGITIALDGEQAADKEGEGSTSPTGLTARALEWPGGRVAVAIVGAATIAVAGYQFWKGVRQGFLDDIDDADLGPARRRLLAVLGTAGFIARALAIATAGTLFVTAALTRDPQRAAGLDDSLHTLAGAPGGRVLLTATGLGLVAAGLYDMATFRRQRLQG